MMDIPWIILSHTNGFRETHFTHEIYFECESDDLAIGIIQFYFLSISSDSREKYFGVYLRMYLRELNDKWGMTIGNNIKYRFEKWLKPVLRFFNLNTTQDKIQKTFILNEASGIVIEYGLEAYRNWKNHETCRM
jgi:hypothetical protein